VREIGSSVGAKADGRPRSGDADNEKIGRSRLTGEILYGERRGLIGSSGAVASPARPDFLRARSPTGRQKGYGEARGAAPPGASVIPRPRPKSTDRCARTGVSVTIGARGSALVYAKNQSDGGCARGLRSGDRSPLTGPLRTL
jgi:hypothetical protein